MEASPYPSPCRDRAMFDGDVEEAESQVSLAAAPIFGTPRHVFETTTSEAQRELVWPET